MSLRTLLIWCIIAGLLGGAAVILREQHAKSVQSSVVEWGGLQFDPAAVTRLEIDSGTGRAVLERDADSIDNWSGSWSIDDAAQRWAIASTRIRGALRTLSTGQIRLSDEQLIEDGTRLTLRSRNDSSVELLIGDDRSGGRTPVRVEQRDESGAIERVLDGWMESGIADALTVRNTLAWRDERLMSIAMSGVDGVRIQAGPYETRLELSGTQWQITAPIAVRAERERVEGLIRSLVALRAGAFVDRAIDPETSGLSSPLAEIELWSGSDAYRLVVGKAADVGGDSLYASFSRNDAETLIQIPTTSLSKLTAVPDAYVSTRASGVSQTRVRGLRVLGKDGDVRFETVLDDGSWVQNGTRVDTLSERSVQRLLGLLTQTSSDAVRVLEDDSALPKVIAGIEIVDEAGERLGRYDVSLEPSDQGMRLLLSSELEGGRLVVWAYVGEDAQATGTWLTLTAGRPVAND
ncbi:MAG: DUF4340 domain-containing protein [Phycisphaerales bacterium]|nr:DUF4340 domain-containing protein [Phycisphaerales bacterium]